VHGFWSVDELADGCIHCGEVARGRCLFASNISVKTSTVLTEGQRKFKPSMTLCYFISNFLLSTV